MEKIERGLAEVEAAVTGTIGTEIWMDMNAFGTVFCFVVQVELVPAKRESVPKLKQYRIQGGIPCREATLVTATVCVARPEGAYLHGKFN